ncbi:XRE family transcriptional regulator [Kitasatospora sp. NPDC090091]|uniref:MmyB family transcriptional regulator n=1 Tax=Kitasatospora sp. NPDC090091 TaxID=3364081 RepID=UPI00380DBB27
MVEVAGAAGSIGDKPALKALLSKLRSQLGPADVGLPVSRYAGKGRRPASGLRQSDIDLLTDRSPGTYSRFESGSERPRPTESYLLAVARALRMTEEDWRALWLYRLNSHPPYPLKPEASVVIGEHWQDIVDDYGGPAYITDRAWKVRFYNQRFADIFPNGIPPENTMEWMVLSRYSREVGLPDWENSWARLVLPQLRAAYNQFPQNRELGLLVRKVEKDPVAGPLYASLDESYRQPDGDTRFLWHAGRNERVTVTMGPSMPLAAPGFLLMHLLLNYRAKPSNWRDHTHPLSAPIGG